MYWHFMFYVCCVSYKYLMGCWKNHIFTRLCFRFVFTVSLLFTIYWLHPSKIKPDPEKTYVYFLVLLEHDFDWVGVLSFSSSFLISLLWKNCILLWWLFACSDFLTQRSESFFMFPTHPISAAQLERCWRRVTFLSSDGVQFFWPSSVGGLRFLAYLFKVC